MRAGALSGPPRRARPSTADEVTLDGEAAFVPDAPGAGLLVAVGIDDDGDPVAVAVDPAADGVTIEPVVRYDATRSMAHVSSMPPAAAASRSPRTCSPTPGTWPTR